MFKVGSQGQATFGRNIGVIMPRGFFMGLFGGFLVGAVLLALASIVDQAPGSIPPKTVAEPDAISAADPVPQADIIAAQPDSRPSTDVSKTKVTGNLADPILLSEVTDAGAAPDTIGRPDTQLAVLDDINLTSPIIAAPTMIDALLPRANPSAELATPFSDTLPMPQLTGQ